MGRGALTGIMWRDGRLAGFFDWDMAGLVPAAWDVAFAAFSWGKDVS